MKGPIWEGVYASFVDVPVTGPGFSGEIWRNNSLKKISHFRELSVAEHSIPPVTINRDSLLPILTAFVSAEGSSVVLLDYGGGIGFSYYQVQSSLPERAILKFHIVELEDVCRVGREFFVDTPNIFFHESLPDVWSHSLLFNGVIKAWHFHRIQTDWWYVASGVLRVGLYDMRPDSSTFKKTMDFLMGDLQQSQVVKKPPGVAHGCKTIQGPVNLFYVTSHVYNPDDEIRIAYNDPEMNFDWLKGPEIK